MLAETKTKRSCTVATLTGNSADTCCARCGGTPSLD